MAIYYVTSSGTALLAEATNSNTPTNIQRAFEGLVSGLTSGDVIKIQAGEHALSASILTTAVNDGTTANPIKFVACDSMWNEIFPDVMEATKRLDFTNKVNVSMSSYYLTFTNCNYLYFQGLNFYGGRAGVMVYIGPNSTMLYCKVVNQYNSTSAVAIRAEGNGSTFYACDFACTGMTSSAALFLYYGYCKIIRCVIYDSGSIGIQISSGGNVISRCLIYGYTTIGIQISGASSYAYFIGNTIVGGVNCVMGATSDQFSYSQTFVDNIMTGASGYGVLYSHALGATGIFLNNRMYNNASGNISWNGTLVEMNSVTSVGVDFKDSAEGNYMLQTTSPAVLGGMYGGPIGAVVPSDWPLLSNVSSVDTMNGDAGTLVIDNVPSGSPDLSISVSGLTVTATVVGEGTIQLLYKKRSDPDWTLGNSRTGNRVITQTMPTTGEEYYFCAVCVSGGIYSLPSNFISAFIDGGNDDPLTQVYEALWRLIENNTALAGMIKAGNRIKSTSEKEKTTYSNSDLPELIIRPAGGKCEIKKSTTSMPITQVFSVICTTGDLRVDKSFFPVKWALLNALTDTAGNLGLGFVRRVSLSDVTDGRNTERLPGWNTAFEINVEMWFGITEEK